MSTCEFRNQLLSLSKDQLIEKIVQLNEKVNQLESNIEPTTSPKSLTKPTEDGNAGQKRNVKEFDFDKFNKRHIALQFLYLGWQYDGYVVQDNTDNTVENHLFNALMKTKLIKSRETSNYHRCGRTDKGVSAFSQVISLDVRSNLSNGIGLIRSENYCIENNDINDNDDKEEINYCKVLNSVLPSSIRCIAWSPVKIDFSSRFNCRRRTYKYFFPIGDLNLPRMRIAASYLIGEHDLRNFCRMDVNNGVINYVRRIFSISIDHLDSNENVHANDNAHLDEGEGKERENFYEMICLTVKGQAFLWHQIRCIIALLFLVGKGKEEPEIIEHLLDINLYPQKPHYNIAADFPLVLFECEYDNEEVNWIYEKNVLRDLIDKLQANWTESICKASITKSMLNHLENQLLNERICNQNVNLTIGVKSHSYIQLAKRPVCESLEEKIMKVNAKKQRRKLTNGSAAIS